MRGETGAAWAALAACMLAGIACRRSAEAPPAPAASRADPRVDAATGAAGNRPDAAVVAEAGGAASDEDAATAARLNGLICKRPRCCVTRVMPAGVGGDGTRYTVVRVDLLPGRRRCAPPQTGEQEDVVDPEALAAEKDGELDEKQHKRYRWDLVEEKGGKVRWRQPLEIDDWGVSDFGMGGGEDGVSADPAARTVSYSNDFGSAWRGGSSVTVGLDPFRIVEFSKSTSWRGGQDESSLEWSWDTFSGKESTSTAFCRTGPGPDAGFLPEALDGDTSDNDEPVASSDEVIVPMIALPAGFVDKGWSTTLFRSCAAHVDGKDLGFTIHGPARGDSGDSEMWVVMSSGGVLLVEVTDDRLVPAAKSWVKADHLELWRVSDKTGSGRGSGCFQANPDAKALQWGVGLDGRVYRAHGAPASDPSVRVTRTERGARFRIVLPADGGGLTVVYSDSDDGTRQKRLIATSNLRFGRPWTIGSVTPIGPSQATCVVTGGALRPKVAPLRRYPDLLFPNLSVELSGD
jgi:hypothetical protein